MNTITASLNVDTPLGPLYVTASDDALVSASFDPSAMSLPPNALCRRAEAQLHAYFAGERALFDLALAPAGTVFQRQVWQALVEVPWGGRITYGTLAARLGRPSASRAVGAAVGRNPLAIFIPCHRVMGADGRLTGFAWGLERKRALLALEAFDACA